MIKLKLLDFGSNKFNSLKRLIEELINYNLEKQPKSNQIKPNQTKSINYWINLNLMKLKKLVYLIKAG